MAAIQNAAGEEVSLYQSDVPAITGEILSALRTTGRSLIVLVTVAVVVVAIDQFVKLWVVTTIKPRLESGEGPILVLGEFLKFTYVENTGAAFSLGTGYTWIFSIIAIVVALVDENEVTLKRLRANWAIQA